MYILFTQFGAFVDAIRNVIIKNHKSKVTNISSLTFTWAWLIFTLLLLLPLGMKDGIPQIAPEFYVAFFARIILDPVGIYLYNFSIQYYKISSVLPLLSFGPVFSYIVGILLLKEVPSTTATIGIGLVIVGVYLLNLQKGKPLLDPFKEMYRNKGNLYVVIAAALWGILVPFFKLGGSSSSTLFYTGVSSLGVVIVFTLLILIFKRHELKHLKKLRQLGVFAGLGLLDGTILLFRMIALETGKAAVVSALNRTSIIFGSIIGGIFFKEKIRDKILPTICMLIGVVLIVLR